MAWSCGFGGAWTDFASLAKKNFVSAADGVGLFARPTSDTVGLNETVGLFAISLSSPAIPRPDPNRGTWPATRGNSFVDGGAGVPLGVPVGVVCVLSTLDFLDPDRGVILLLKKAETGVDRSSLEDAKGGVLSSGRAPRRPKGVEAGVGAEPATLGVNGIRCAVFVAEALRVGIDGRFCLSYEGILFAALPLFAVKGALRTMALWSRVCNGGLKGGHDGRGRVGVFSWLLLFSRLLVLSDIKVALIVGTLACFLPQPVLVPSQ